MLDVLKDLRKKLADAFPDIEAHVKVPDPRPSRLIVIRRGGGRWQDRLIDSPGIHIECWAPSESEAQNMADKVADFMESLRFADGYADVHMESMYSDPDPMSKSPRYFISYTLKTYDPERG